MPVIRRWRQEMILEEPEEFIGAEMYPFLSNVEETPEEAEISAPESSFLTEITTEKKPEDQGFWIRIRTLFQAENW